jgi:hypothetical protein
MVALLAGGHDHDYVGGHDHDHVGGHDHGFDHDYVGGHDHGFDHDHVGGHDHDHVALVWRLRGSGRGGPQDLDLAFLHARAEDLLVELADRGLRDLVDERERVGEPE